MREITDAPAAPSAEFSAPQIPDLEADLLVEQDSPAELPDTLVLLSEVTEESGEPPEDEIVQASSDPEVPVELPAQTGSGNSGKPPIKPPETGGPDENEEGEEDDDLPESEAARPQPAATPPETTSDSAYIAPAETSPDETPEITKPKAANKLQDNPAEDLTPAVSETDSPELSDEVEDRAPKESILRVTEPPREPTPEAQDQPTESAENHIDVDPALNIGHISEADPEAPIPVQQHVESLNTLIGDMSGEGEVGPDAIAFTKEFANRHDKGYSADLAVLDTDEGKAILAETLEEVGSSADPEAVVDYLQTNADNYLAARVIGHGVVGLVENTLHYQERGMSPDQAQGMATIMAAHHPGFPITMVSGFLSGEAAIPTEMRSALLIDKDGEDPEALRSRLVEVAANKLDLPGIEVGKAAVLGYALDRITPGRVPDAVRIHDDGSTEVNGGEVVQKKYGLVAGDLLRDTATERPSVEGLYDTVIDHITTEAQSAVQAAQTADQPQLITFVNDRTRAVIGQTADTQREALAALRAIGLSGEFEQLTTERDALLAAARRSDDPALRYALATYDAVIPQLR